jgi:NAD(P)-dependent dehydrogenase (short-subunit alcohol dehydrogenase family)
MGVLEGKVAAITGAGRGIGRGIAILFAQEGANVVVNDPGVNPDGSGSQDGGPADQVVEEITSAGGTAIANYDSVAETEGGENIVKTAVDNYGRIDILVNNAGILRDRMIFNMSEDEWDVVMAVHLKGHFNTIKPASQLMRQQRHGRIINFSSESGLWGNAGQGNYGAAKSAIAGLTRVVARDLGRYGVTCNAIVPRAWTRLTATIPQRDAGGPQPADAPEPEGIQSYDPDMIAPMVAYLASDEAWNVNGQDFLVYSGVVAVLNHPVPWRSISTPDIWTLDELDKMVPRMMEGTRNPAPPPENLDVPGRDAATTVAGE